MIFFFVQVQHPSEEVILFMDLDIFKHRYRKKEKIEILEQFCDLTLLEKWLIMDEDILTRPYLDSLGNWTDGVGNTFNVIPGNDKRIKEVMNEFKHNIFTSISDYNSIFGDFDTIHSKEDVRKCALINMLFNLGKSRFLKFKKMIEVVKQKDWEKASIEALDSIWAKQVGKRADRIAQALKTGIKPKF